MFFINLSLTYLTVYVTVLLLCAYIYLTKTFKYWKNKSIKYEKPLPIFGNCASVIFGRVSVGEMYNNLYKKYSNEKYVGVFKSSKPDLMLRDLDLIKHVLVKDFQYFHDRDDIMADINDPLHKNLFSVNGERWRIMRQKFTPIFTSSKLKNMFYLIVEKSTEFQKLVNGAVKSGEEMEIRDLFAKFTTDVIGSCAFGVTMNSMSNENALFRKMGETVFKVSVLKQFKFVLLLLFPKVFNFMKLKIMDQDVEDFFISTVRHIVEERKFSQSKRHDFIDLMIALKENPKDEEQTIEFDDIFLTAQAFVFFVAGYETSSTLMSFVLHELAYHPEIQQKVQDEIDNTILKYDGNITYEGILEMKYLEMVMCEAQRKYPALSVLTRICNHSYVFPDTDLSIEKGVYISIPVSAIHNDSQYYPDPEKFIPERFEKDEINARHQMVFLPFGEGPRNCIGMRFGKIQSAVGLASFLHKFSVEPSLKTEQKITLDPTAFVTTSKNGFWLKVTSREMK